MSKGFVVCVICAIASFAGGLVNLVMLAMYGEVISAAAVVFGAVVGGWCTYCALDVRHMDREMREWRR